MPRFPLSHPQRRIWFAEQEVPGTSLNNLSLSQAVPAQFDNKDLTRAWNRILETHDGLRLRFQSPTSAQDDFPVSQSVAPYTACEVASQTFASQQEAESWMESLAHEAFPLKDQPLWRFQAFQVEGAESWSYLVVVHHLISDGWSLNLLRHKIYQALETDQLDQAPSYQQFVDSESAYLNSAEKITDRQFWLDNLKDAPEPFELGGRGQGDPFLLRKVVPEKLALACQKVVETTGLSLFKQVMAALTVCVARMYRVDRFSIGLANHNRSEPSLHSVLGMFVSTMPLVRDYSPDQSFFDLAKQTSIGVDTLLKQHARYPFNLLVADQREQWGQDVGHTTTLSLIGHPNTDDVYHLVTPGSVPRGLAIHLNFAGKAKQGYLAVAFAGDGKSVTPVEAETLYGALLNVLTQGLKQPDTAVGQLPLVSRSELEHLLSFNGDFIPYPEKETIVSLFARQAKANPEKEALLARSASLTYAQLDSWSDQIARALLESNAGTPLGGRFVGVCLARGAEMVAAILAILKAGGAYIPLDPEYPKERLAFMIEDAGITQAVAHQQFFHLLDGLATVDPSTVPRQGSSLNAVQVNPNDVAYAIYTSGTTGKPKGVPIAHHQVVHLWQSLSKPFLIDGDTRALLFASLNFDASVPELFLPLLHGGTVIVADEEQRADGGLLLQLLAQAEISWATIPPALLAVMMPPPKLPCLRDLVVAGESTDPTVIAEWGQGRRMINGYGPTENTVATSAGVFEAGASSQDIGPPIENVHCYVLDSGLLPVPVGVAGELYAAGVGLSTGYLNRPELTAERFLPNPYARPESRNPRMYKTGDLVRWNPRGRLEFIGRVDFQVKIRGHRIECGEVSTAIGNLEGVASCIVVPIPHGSTHRLVAYVIAEPNRELTSHQLALATGSRLPAYMVPSAFVFLDRFPRTPNGKIDRRALPLPTGAGDRTETAYRPPTEGLESTLCEIWTNVLGVDRVGADDDFFDLGGDSLSCMKVVAQAEEQGLNFKVSQLRDFPTVASLVDHLRTAQTTTGSLPVLSECREAGPFPLPLNALMMHRQEQSMLAAGARPLPMPALWSIEGAVDRQAMQRALRAVIGRHDALRLRIVDQGDEVWLHPVAEDPTPQWEQVEAERFEATLKTWMESASADDQPSCQFRLIYLSDGRHLMAMRGTHELLDAWASGLVCDDLGEAYTAIVEGGALDSAQPTSLRSFTGWYHNLIESGHLESSRSHWSELLSGATSLYASPPAPQTDANPYQTLSAAIPLPLTLRNQFDSLCQAHKSTMFEGCLAVYRILVASRSETDDSGLIAFVTALRDTKELQSVVGSLTNRLYMKAAVKHPHSFHRVLEEVRADLRATREHSLWPSWRDVDPTGSGFPDLFFHYVAPAGRTARSFSGLTLTPHPPKAPPHWPLGCAFQVIDHTEHPLLLCLARAGFCDTEFLEVLMSDFVKTMTTIIDEAKESPNNAQA